MLLLGVLATIEEFSGRPPVTRNKMSRLFIDVNWNAPVSSSQVFIYAGQCRFTLAFILPV